MSKQPNFFIVGAPKAGTTSLYHYLENHEQVFLSTPKEVNFFNNKELTKEGMYYDDFKASSLDEYLALFSGVDINKHSVIGEASVSYLAYTDVAEKIKKFNNDSKIVIMLRNPIQRAFSHYLMDFRLGLCKNSFEEVLFNKEKHPLHYKQYVELGMYYQQVKSFFDVFEKENIKIFFLEEYKGNELVMLNELFDFLKIDKSSIQDLNTDAHNKFMNPSNKLISKIYSNYFIRNILSSLFNDKRKDYLKSLFFNNKKPIMSDQTKEFLYDTFNNDSKNLFELIDKKNIWFS